MRNPVKIAVRTSLILSGLGLIGLGVLFVVIGLEAAGEWSSIIGLFAGLIGLGVAVYGVVLARREPGAQVPGQSVARSRVGGVLQIGGVQGSLRVGGPNAGTDRGSPSSPAGPASTPESTPRSAASSPPISTPAQSVSDVETQGFVRQVRDVGGDAEIDQ